MHCSFVLLWDLQEEAISGIREKHGGFEYYLALCQIEVRPRVNSKIIIVTISSFVAFFCMYKWFQLF